MNMSYMKFWVKANAEAGTWHPLVYHMLEAAVGGEWVEVVYD